MCFDFGTEAFLFGCILFLGLSSEQITSRSRFAQHKVSKLQKLSRVLSDHWIYTDSLVSVKGFAIYYGFGAPISWIILKFTNMWFLNFLFESALVRYCAVSICKNYWILRTPKLEFCLQKKSKLTKIIKSGDESRIWTTNWWPRESLGINILKVWKKEFWFIYLVSKCEQGETEATKHLAIS